MTAQLPWMPCVAFTGQSDYVVDLESGSVVQHIDYWDSLEDSKYFSFSGLADFITQCRPHVGPMDLGGFDLLRRTDSFEVRRFNKSKEGVGLALVKDAATMNTWQVSSTACQSVRTAVVVQLKSAPKTNSEIVDVEKRLRHQLRYTQYASPGDRVFYVCANVRNRDFHEIWVELSDASAPVDD